MAIFVVSSLILMSTLVSTGFTQGDALRQAADIERAQVHTDISVKSATELTTVGNTTITLSVDNPGAVILTDRLEMEVIVSYMAPDGTSVVKRLTFVTTTPPGDDEWTVSTIEPDAYNPGLWDPGEWATIKLKVAPPLKTASVATVIVGAPNGVTASVSLST